MKWRFMIVFQNHPKSTVDWLLPEGVTVFCWKKALLASCQKKGVLAFCHLPSAFRSQIRTEHEDKDIFWKRCPASADSIHPKFAALPPEKKCAFKMSATEDSLELDEDIGSNVPASKPFSEGNGKQEMPLVNSKFVSSEELSKNKGLVFPEINTPPGFLSKRTDEQTPNGVNAVKYSGISTNEDLQAGKLNNT